MTLRAANRKIGELVLEGSITAIQDGNHGESHPKASEYVPAGIPFIMASDIRDGRVVLTEAKHLPKARTDMLRTGFALPGDVLLTHKGTVGQVAIAPTTPHYLMLTPQVTYYRTNPKQLDARYLAFAFRSSFFQTQLANISAQSTRPYISITTQRHLIVPWHPIGTQRHIARILGAYDDLIEVNRRRIAVLDEIARRLFEEWFVRFRFPGHPGRELPQGTLPERWTRVPLEQVCEKITDGSHHSPPSVETGRMMASVKDMCDWDFDLSGCRRISEENFGDLVRNGCRPLVGDILIAKDGANLNKHTFLMWRDVPVVLLSSIAILRPRKDIQREFLVALLRSLATSEAIKLMKSGAAIPRIVLRDFKRLDVMMPPSELRERFNEVVAPIHDMIRRLSLANGMLATSRDLLLPRIISGELSVPAAEPELETAA